MLRFLVRLVLLPFRVVLRTLALAFGLGRTVGSLPVKATTRLGRLFGFRTVVGLVLGAALGLLFAPGPGRELRQRLSALAASRRPVDDGDLADRVVFELEHAPRTWHLPQPSVAVADGRVVLSGTVALDAARDELGRVAEAVPGVAAVENRVAVEAEAGDDQVAG
jgi:hypothetical protein